jgi:hypothetical protein
MIRHCVFVRFKAAFSRAGREAVFADLDGLKARIPGMLRFTAGGSVSPEDLGHGFADGFLIDFSDADARDRYLEHPEHQAIGARIHAAAEGGADGIFVFDFDLDP